MTARFLCCLLLGLSSCAELPKDPNGTLERIKAQRLFRVGIIAPGADDPADLARQRLLIDRLASATGARPRIGSAASEELLAALEEGSIDLVVGELAKDSPWKKRVALLPPLEPEMEGESKSAVKLHALARNGENAWIELLHREAKAVAKAGS